MQDNPNKSASKKRLFFTFRPEKRLFYWLIGARSLRNTKRAVGDFQDSMLHGDQRNAYWTASLSEEQRTILADRVRREAWLYLFVAVVLGGGSLFTSVQDALQKQFGSGLLWLIFGFIGSVFGAWMATIKFWQSSNVRNSSYISLRYWLFGEK